MSLCCCVIVNEWARNGKLKRKSKLSAQATSQQQKLVKQNLNSCHIWIVHAGAVCCRSFLLLYGVPVADVNLVNPTLFAVPSWVLL